MNISAPLVSIGIPAYNRENMIGRAIQSALEQDYPHIELIISDNASTDETEKICREYAARDSRVIYIRQSVNQGAAANFNTVFQQARGEYFLWLGDDDWFDLNYVSTCVRFLEENPDHILAYGRVRYYRGKEFDSERPGFSVLYDDPATRVWNYYGEVDDNAMFYGVMRRSVLDGTFLLRGIMGDDWLLMASVVFRGKASVLPETCVHRTLGGASASHHKMVASLGLHPIVAYFPVAYIAWWVFKEIAWESPVYSELGRWGRLKLALRCQPSLWKRQIWFTLAPAAFALSKRSFTRPLYRSIRGTYLSMRAVYRWLKALRHKRA
jgi:glycosyltransferase involved in cell wall biosynthesis